MMSLNSEICRKTLGWTVMPILLLCLWNSGCKTRSSDEAQQFRLLSDGFQLMLVDNLPAKAPIQELDPSSLHNTYPADQMLIPGRIYVFRKRTGTTNETLGMKVLPDRLKKIGARVTQSPQSSKDFLYLYIGGPLFLIKFEKDSHQGTIFNRVHTSSTPREYWEELIVAYK